jgi:monoamine oxidase
MYDVIIIGGGAAGLMASKLLSEAGKNILLLEASGQLGGRIRRKDNFTFPAQAGAEFIHGDLHTTFEALKEAGIKKAKLKGNFCRVEKGKWTMDENLVPHWELLIKKLKGCNENISVDQFLLENFHAKKYEKIRNQFKKYVQGYDAADTKDASVLAIKYEMAREDENQYRPVSGYEILAEYLRDTCNKHNGIIKTKEPVRKVIHKINNVDVLTSSGKYTAEKVVIAVPLGILQARRNRHSFIDFPACLGAYTKNARRIGNGSVIKILLEFDHAFWLDNDFLKSKHIPPPSYFFADTIIPTWWTQYPSKRPLLTGWVAGPPALKMKNYSERKFKMLLMNSLSSIFSLPTNDIENRLINFKVINWSKEDYILGGYSYSTLQTEEARKFLNQPFKKTFYFAGEYLPENSSSTVDAALQSGKSAAMQIILE